MRTVQILYEDPAVIVVVKPPGLPSQPERSTAMDMVSYLKNLLAARDKVKNPYIGVVHRLDRPVGGIMVYAKNKTAAANLSAQIASRAISKEYLAVVRGIMEKPHGTLEDLLIRDGRTNLSRVAGESEANGAKKAVLSYEVLEAAQYEGHNYSLLKIKLLTGRHHQIRVQLANLGHPIAGDKKYGSDCKSATRYPEALDGRADPFWELGLFSSSLEFVHPIKKKPVRYRAEPAAQPFLMFHCQRITE